MRINRETYLQRQRVLQNRIGKRFVPEVQKVLTAYISQVVAAVRAKGVHAAQGMVHGDIVLNGLTTVLKQLYMQAVRDAVKKPVVSTKALPPFVLRVLQFLDKYLLNKVVLPISTTTIKQIDKILDEALNKGWGVEQTIKELEGGELSKWRAKMIVRTETVRAANFAQTIAADQNEYETEKMWIAVEDSRTRLSHTHAGVDGERVDLYDTYSNGLMYPGDPTGSAKETINCRCTQGFFAKRDLDGNLVRKQHRDIDLLTLLSQQAA